MADETYRKFHSGRFGPEDIDIKFDTNISGAPGVTTKDKKKKPKDDEDDKDEVGNTYDSPETANMFDSQNKFMAGE